MPILNFIFIAITLLQLL